ncbi:TPA: hypothetical protein ACJCPP_001537, partial [Neisseria meningitidis]
MIHKTAYPHNFDKAFLTFPAPSRNQHSGGFAFEVQLSLTEKGQYAVAYDLSCKKDCHELHATDP